MRSYLQIVVLASAAVAAGARAESLDPRALIERAVALVEAQRFSLARVYLEPALIDYRLSPGERSRAYYIRGYSFFAQGLYASAAQDYHRALEFNPGNPVVLSAAAQLHLDGHGVDRNPELAVDLFRQAADAGLADGELRLGLLYLKGIGVEQNLDEARRWFAAAAEGGSTLAMLQMAQTWRAPWADPPDPAKALEWFERAHAAGEADALAYAGFMYEDGVSGVPDLAAARGHFETAAAAGSALAQAKLAHMHLIGEGAEQDAAQALALFRAAADQGYPPGYMGLAYLYEAGEGVAVDPDAARDWYAKAAEAGMIDAQLHMAYAALREKTPQGATEAAAWLARAAAQRNARAMNDYAWLLATSGHAEVRDGPRAVTLARNAVALERSPSHLDTLAAAYAEVGLFEQAVATQREALAAAPPGAASLIAELETHLSAFAAGKPWRE